MKATRARKGHDPRTVPVHADATRVDATRVNATRANAVYETMRLYHAWIGYLLTRLGERTVRVQVEDIRNAMDRFRCSVSREADAYVIRLGADSDTSAESFCREKEGSSNGERDGNEGDAHTHGSEPIERE